MSWNTRHVFSVGEVATAANVNNNDGNLDFVWHEVAESDLATFTNITATTEATANTFATVTFTANGTSTCLLEAQWYATKGTSFINFALYLDGTDQGVIQTTNAIMVAGTFPYRWSQRLVPASGSRTYTLRAWVDAGTGTAGGGAGGVGVALSGYFRALQQG